MAKNSELKEYAANWPERISNLQTFRMIDDLVNEIYQTPELVEEIIIHLTNSNQTVAWRTAWIIDKMSVKNRFLIEPHHKALVSVLKKTPNNSIRRHLTKILAANLTKECEDGELIDKCLNWIIHPKVPVAVKANTMQLLYKLCKLYPELIPEFCLVIEEGIPTGSQGYKTKARNILKSLKP